MFQIAALTSFHSGFISKSRFRDAQRYSKSLYKLSYFYLRDAGARVRVTQAAIKPSSDHLEMTAATWGRMFCFNHLWRAA
jgi:hypothetical protein